MSEHESLILDLRILRDCEIDYAEQCSIVNEAISTIEDLKRQLANADSILDEQIKAREDTIEKLRCSLEDANQAKDRAIAFAINALPECKLHTGQNAPPWDQFVATVQGKCLMCSLEQCDQLQAKVKERDATIELLRQELQSVIATANLAQSKYDLVCYELGMIGSNPSEVVERIRALQAKLQIEQNVVKIVQAENYELRECNKSLQYKVKDLEALLTLQSHQCS